MSSLDSIYGSGGGSFLKPKDFESEDEKFFFWIKSAKVIRKVFREEEGEKAMIELEFFEIPENPHSSKRWSLNRTQAEELESLYGAFGTLDPDSGQQLTDNWKFKGFRCRRGKTKFQGETKATIIIEHERYVMEPDAQKAAQAILDQQRSGPTHTGSAPQAASVSIPPPPASDFTPPTGFAPPSADNDPTSNW